jgi:hypothetical protein
LTLVIGAVTDEVHLSPPCEAELKDVFPGRL